jgi:hypothetical protein
MPAFRNSSCSETGWNPSSPCRFSSQWPNKVRRTPLQHVPKFIASTPKHWAMYVWAKLHRFVPYMIGGR